MRSSIAFVRCAVVRPDSPPLIGPSSTTITFLPALISMYATERPAIPAPTTHTSHCALPPSDGKLGTSKVPIHMEAVSPPGLVLCSRIVVDSVVVVSGRQLHAADQFRYWLLVASCWQLQTGVGMVSCNQ